MTNPTDAQPHSGPSAANKDTAEQSGHAIATRFAGAGWIDFNIMASELGWSPAQTNMALRWLRKVSAVYVVESRIQRGVAKVRVSRVPVEEKHARQLSTDVSSLLAKVYVHLKHSERSRHRLAYDVKTIAIRMAPYLDQQEFQIECKKCLIRIQRSGKDIPIPHVASDEVFSSDEEDTLDIPSPLEAIESEALAGLTPLRSPLAWRLSLLKLALPLCLLSVVVLAILYLLA